MARDDVTIEQWEAENREKLAPTIRFLHERFVDISPGAFSLWDKDESTRRAALDAIRALTWLIKPIEQEVIKLYKEPYTFNERNGGDGA